MGKVPLHIVFKGFMEDVDDGSLIGPLVMLLPSPYIAVAIESSPLVCGELLVLYITLSRYLLYLESRRSFLECSLGVIQ